MTGNTRSRWQLKRRGIIDLAVLSVGAVFLLALLAFAGIEQSIDNYVGDRMILGMELDDFFLFFIYLVAALAIFSLRRQRDLNREIERHVAFERSLTESEEKFRAIADAASDAIISVDSEGNIIYCNRAVGTIYGYEPQELAGQSVSLLMPEDMRSHYMEQFGRDATTGIPPAEKRMEVTARRKDGSNFAAEMSLSEWEAGGQRFLSAMIHDITEMKADREALARDEERFRGMVEHAPNAVILFDENGIIFANPASLKLIGARTEAELLGRSPLDFVHPDSLATATDRQKQVLAQAALPPVEERLVRLDGSVVYVEVLSAPMVFRNKQVVQVIAQDITQRRADAERLRRSESRYRKLVEAARDVIFTIDLESSKLTSISPSMEALTGWQAEDWLGKQFTLLLHPDDLPKAVKIIDELRAGHQPGNFDLRVNTSARDFIPVEFSVKSLYDGDRISGVIGIARDVSERRYNEAILARQSYELKEKTEELEALNRVSATVNQNLNLVDMLKQSLHTISRLEILSLERAGGIMLVEGDQLRLVAHLGHSREFLSEHENVTIYDCLCGLAARTGEMVTSDSSSNDIRHSIRYPGMKPHGHVILPLKAYEKVVGVMYFYLPSHAQLEERQLSTLTAISDHLGLAIANAQLYAETEHLSQHDPLTGLGNRNLMKIDLHKCMARAKRSGEAYSLILFDLDHFKHYNDTYGHSAGDRLLAAVGGIIRSAVRETDTPVRFGGEEFLIIMPDTASAAATEAAERIRSIVMNSNFGDEGSERRITISAGVAEWQPDVLRTDDMIVLADSSLYEAKRRGRNQVFTFLTESDRCTWHGGEIT